MPVPVPVPARLDFDKRAGVGNLPGRQRAPDNGFMSDFDLDLELDLLDLTGYRRSSPRVTVEALCLEVEDAGEHEAQVLNLSQRGVRLERPYLGGGGAPREVYLELAVPGIDEILVARGQRCFDQIGAPGPHSDGGPLGLVRRTGYRLAAACTRDFNMLREYVIELHRERLAAQRHEGVAAIAPAVAMAAAAGPVLAVGTSVGPAPTLESPSRLVHAPASVVVAPSTTSWFDQLAMTTRYA